MSPMQTFSSPEFCIRPPTSGSFWSWTWLYLDKRVELETDLCALACRGCFAKRIQCACCSWQKKELEDINSHVKAGIFEQPVGTQHVNITTSERKAPWSPRHQTPNTSWQLCMPPYTPNWWHVLKNVNKNIQTCSTSLRLLYLDVNLFCFLLGFSFCICGHKNG